MRAVLTARAWLELFHMDLVVRRGFRAVHRCVSETRTRPITADSHVLPDVLDAVTWACVWYFKTPRCLQKSAVVTRLLRRRGVPAEMLVGCHPEPLRAHAWVVVAGSVVSDDLHDLEHYHVLDRW